MELVYSIVWFAAWVVVSPHLSVAVHELGHLCAAVAVRWPVKHVEIGEGGDIHLIHWPIDVYLGRNPLSGSVFISTDRLKDLDTASLQRYRTPLAIIGAAGPVFSLVAGFLLLKMGLYAPGIISIFYGAYAWETSDGQVVKEYIRGVPLTIKMEEGEDDVRT